MQAMSGDSTLASLGWREDETRVDSLRIRGAGRDTPALRLSIARLIGASEAKPPGAPPSSILLIRRLEDPLPGKLRPSGPDLRPSPEWERAIGDRLGRAYREASRPRVGWLPSGAQAVVFSDPGEMLACLAIDLSRGVALERWWWRAILRASPSAPSLALAHVFLQNIRRLPAVLDRLVVWRQARTVMDLLAPEAAIPLLTLMSRTYDAADLTPRLNSPPGAGPGTLSDSPEATEAAAPGARPFRRLPDLARGALSPGHSWSPWLADVEVPIDWPVSKKALLLGGLLLFRAPLVVRGASFARAWREAWVQESQPSLADTATVGPTGVPARSSDALTPLRATDPSNVPAPDRVNPRLPSNQGSSSEGTGRRDVGARDSSKPVAVPRPPNPDHPLGADRPEFRWAGIDGDSSLSGLSPEIPVAAGREDSRGGPATVASSEGGRSIGATIPMPGDRPERSRAALPEGFPTRFGGVLFLINLMRRLDLPECFEATCELAGTVGAWGTLELLARGLTDAESEVLVRDPIWTALAELEVRPSGARLGEAFVGSSGYDLPETWTKPTVPLSWPPPGTDRPALRGVNPRLFPWLAAVVPYVRHRLEASLGPASPDEALMLRRGRLYVTATHVDLVMRMEEITLPVRLAGLDADPGWLPAFGRVVRFHYE